MTETASITKTPPTTDEEQLLFATNRDHADEPADRERAGVAHENFARDGS